MSSDTTGRRGRGRRILLVLALVVVLLIVAAFVLAETVGRSIAEDRIETELREQLGGAGDVDASIQGFPFTAQVLAGSLDRVDVTAPDLIVGGTAVDADLSAFGVPIERTGTVDRMEGTFLLSPDAVRAGLALPEGGDESISFGDGEITYETVVDLLVIEPSIVVTLVPELDGDSVLLRATALEVASGNAQVNLGELIDPGRFDQRLCAAALLPAAFTLQGIDVSPDGVTVEVEGSDVPLSAEALQQTGSCS